MCRLVVLMRVRAAVHGGVELLEPPGAGLVLLGDVAARWHHILVNMMLTQLLRGDVLLGTPLGMGDRPRRFVEKITEKRY